MKRVAAVAGILSVLAVLAGCAPAGNTVTITYDRDGEMQAVTYSVPDASCDDRSTSIMRLDKPIGYFIAVWSGEYTSLKGWA